MGGDFIFVDRFAKGEFPTIPKQRVPREPIPIKPNPNIAKAKEQIKRGQYKSSYEIL